MCSIANPGEGRWGRLPLYEKCWRRLNTKMVGLGNMLHLLEYPVPYAYFLDPRLDISLSVTLRL